MERKNTILLTVIAVATLLVAVVGASFAFFAIQPQTEGSKVEVETTTAKAADSFVASTEDTLVLPVTNAVMQTTETDKEAVSDNATITVKLTAGSASASCDYYLTYTDESAEAYSPTVADRLEYTIQGNAGSDALTLKDAEGNDEINMDKVTTFGPFKITDAAEDVENPTELVPTVQTWNLTAKFYNLAENQNKQLNKTFVGNFAVTDVTCVNPAE